VEKEESPRARYARLISTDDFIDRVAENVAAGSRVVEVAETYDIPYGPFAMWLMSTETNRQKMTHAYNARDEWYSDVTLAELVKVVQSNLQDYYDERGHLKDPHDWPAGAARVVAGLKVKELYDNEGQKEGELKEIKLWDKMKAIELLGKHRKLFTEKHEHGLTKTLEDIVAGSNGGK